MKDMFGKGLQKRGQIFGRIDFNHAELPNPSIVATEIFETTREPKCSGYGCGKGHRSQIIFAVRATKSLL
jgi:hypothetical protein